jgi:uncharacterized membrane protein HdeD (DUF308 family)
MYQTTGLASVVTGTAALALPNTSGNSVTTILAITAMVVGVAILLSSAFRYVVKRSLKV